MATMVGTPVIGLYAATRLQRTGPYLLARNGAWIATRRRRAATAAAAPTQLPWHREDRAARRHGSDRGGRCARAARCADAAAPDRRRACCAMSCYHSRMDGILVPISPGELLDKITILRIKCGAHRRCRQARQRAPGAGAARAELAPGGARRPPSWPPRRRRWSASTPSSGTSRIASASMSRSGASMPASSSWRARSTCATTSAPRSSSASTCRLRSAIIEEKSYQPYR